MQDGSFFGPVEVNDANLPNPSWYRWCRRRDVRGRLGAAISRATDAVVVTLERVVSIEVTARL